MTKNVDDAARGAVLIAAPVGKDAALATQVLRQAGIAARDCAGGLRELAEQLCPETNALLITEEALVAAELPALLSALEQQPPWSDVPVIILTSPGVGDEVSVRVLEIFGPRANITLLERPLRSVTLISTVKVALRARRRQREVHELLVQRDTVLNGIGDAFVALDREWRYLYVNQTAAEHARMSAEQMIGLSIWEMYPDAVGGTFHQHAHRALETQTPQQFEKYYGRRQGWLETRIYPAQNGIVVFRTNINARKQQEALIAEADRKLQENETLLRLAIEAADAGTFDFYPLRSELRLSDRCRQLIGVSATAALDYDTFIRAVHLEDLERTEAALAHALAPGSDGRFDIEYRIVGIEDGQERWVAARGRAVRNAGGQAERFTGTMLDITRRKQAELLLQQAKHEAEAANRAKDQFLAMLSHELRTPLTPVLMTIASLRRQSHHSEELQRDLEVLQRNVELEALLIDDLLDVTRIAHGKLELHYDAVDIHGALEHALTICAADLNEKKLNVVRHFEAGEHHSWADGARLQQVFWNLVKNAVKFTPSGGQIAIRTRNDDAHQIVIDISDSGIGIHPSLLPRIFDAFEQGGRVMTSHYGGLGLGLAISKRVMDLHGGTIAAQSSGPGQGATFRVTLKAMETSLLDGTVVFLRDEAARAGANILLAEDHEDTARVLRRILEKAGYQVAHAASVTGALELAAGRHFDLVISDLGLADGSGLDLMRSLHERQGMLGIALSGFGTDDDVAASTAAGFAEHLTKPVDWSHLSAAIERVLARHGSVTSAAVTAAS